MKSLNSKDAYEFIEIDPTALLEQQTNVADVLYLRDLKERKLFLAEGVHIGSVSDICRNILQYNAEDRGKPVEERQPILLYIDSDGGDVASGFKLIDIILASKTPVYTISSFGYSMAFLILIAGHKRFGLKDSTYLLHDGMTGGTNSSSKYYDTAQFMRRQDDRVKNYVTTRTGISPEMYDENVRKEWYMFADEAKEYGVIDHIVGVDVDIDMIAFSN